MTTPRPTRRPWLLTLIAAAALLLTACGDEDAGGGTTPPTVVADTSGSTSADADGSNATDQEITEADTSDTSGAADATDTSGSTSGTEQDVTDQDTSGSTSGTDQDATDQDTSGSTSGTDQDATDQDTSGSTSGTDQDTTDNDTSGGGDTSGGTPTPCPAGCPAGQACDNGTCRAVNDIPAPSQAGEIIFTEVMPDPRRADANGEWLEVFNAGTATFNLRGCVVAQSSGGQFTVNATVNGMVLQPGQHATMGGAGDSALGFDATFNYSSSQFLLANADNTLTLRCDGVDIDAISYSASSTGFSLSLDPSSYSAAANDDAGNWCDAPGGTYSTSPAEEHGSPNNVNPACP